MADPALRIIMEKASKAQLRKVRELLRDRRARDESGLFVAEGAKIVRDMVGKGHVPESVIVSRDFADGSDNEAFLREAESGAISVFVAGNAEFDRISSLQHSQGILAVVKKPRYPELPAASGKDALLVLCDGVQDPGNLGAMIRTSVAFGIDAMLLTGEAVDVYNPKVVRASSGMILDIPIYACDPAELDRLREGGHRLLVSRPREEESEDIDKIREFPGPVILAFGSEGKGVSGEVEAKADGSFHIPIREKAESLNVTAAAAISLYLFARRRGGIRK